MEMDKVVLKFKLNAKGNTHIAYCDEYPQIQGMGPSEGQAIASFWKAFNSYEEKQNKESNLQKRQQKSQLQV